MSVGTNPAEVVTPGHGDRDAPGQADRGAMGRFVRNQHSYNEEIVRPFSNIVA